MEIILREDDDFITIKDENGIGTYYKNSGMIFSWTGNETNKSESQSS